MENALRMFALAKNSFLQLNLTYSVTGSVTEMKPGSFR